MTLLILTLRLGVAALLLGVGLDKARDPSGVVVALERLGLAARTARAAATLLAVIEIGAALGLIFRPGAWLTLLAVLGLGCAFALAGLLALQRGETIRCACFGAGTGGALGTRQLVALPFWIATVALLATHPETLHDVGDSAIHFAAVALALGAVRAFGALPAAQAAHSDRVSAREMHVWLRR